jgi:O-acetyl-ADP-ribose deacetylase (regulator of RNase III)
MKAEISVTLGDITQDDSEVIVNAANETLLGGGGVDGAIHQKAGYGLVEECQKLGGCRQGEAKATRGYNLPAKYIIHTVGPRWHTTDKTREEKEATLKSCYLSSLRVANKLNAKSMAFCSISTGGFCFPLDKAAKIAIATIKEFNEKENKTLETIKIVCFDNDTYGYYTAEMDGNPKTIAEIENLDDQLKLIFDPYSLFDK